MLDLEELIYENKARERKKLELFSDILKNCHAQINRYNREHKVKHCVFSVPFMIAGKPPFDFNKLTKFLLEKLRNNGLFAEFSSKTNQIYISWDERDIDLERYERSREAEDRRKMLDRANTNREVDMINRRKSRSKKNQPSPDVGNVFNDIFGPVNLSKHRKAQRIKQMREQQFRDNIQNQPVQRKSFEEFLRGF